MKTLKYNILGLIFAFFISCSDDSNPVSEVDPVADLEKIYEFPGEDYSLEIYSEKLDLEVGYNEIYIRIRDVVNNKYLTNAEVSWMPLMHMENKKHSAPHSEVRNLKNSVYKGTIVFQMPGNEVEYWDLQFSFKMDGKSITRTHEISVIQPNNDLKKLQVFMGTDNIKYILAYVNPRDPEIGINDFTALLYRMDDMMNFPLVENYSIKIDPRMPGMNNHSSPNNQDLSFNPISKLYEGKLSLSMTGYWKINLKVLNDKGETVKGEDVSETNPESDLYFEVEF